MTTQLKQEIIWAKYNLKKKEIDIASYRLELNNVETVNIFARKKLEDTIKYHQETFENPKCYNKEAVAEVIFLNKTSLEFSNTVENTKETNMKLEIALKEKDIENYKEMINHLEILMSIEEHDAKRKG